MRQQWWSVGRLGALRKRIVAGVDMANYHYAFSYTSSYHYYRTRDRFQQTPYQRGFLLRWCVLDRQRKDTINPTSDQPTPDLSQTTHDTTSSTTEGVTMTENNNRQIALDYATKNAGVGATAERITAAAEAYLRFLDGGSTTSAAAPAAPAPRTGQEIIDLIESKRSVFGAVTTDALKVRASVLRNLPLDEAVVTAQAALQGDGVRLYGRDVVASLTYSIGRIVGDGRRVAAARRQQATTGQAIVDLIEGHRSEYGAYTDELLTAAGRAGFRTTPIADAKRTAVNTLRTSFGYRFPQQVESLIREINAL